MTAREKALELYTKFQLYYWCEFDGYMPDNVETKRIVGKLIDEILNEYWSHNTSRRDWWKEVKQEIEKL